LSTSINKIVNLPVVVSNTMIKNDNHSMTKCHKILQYPFVVINYPVDLST